MAFGGIKLFIQEAQLAWEDSFLGGKDADKIKELTKNIGETKKFCSTKSLYEFCFNEPSIPA